jgi:hypothetical protein
LGYSTSYSSVDSLPTVPEAEASADMVPADHAVSNKGFLSKSSDIGNNLGTIDSLVTTPKTSTSIPTLLQASAKFPCVFGVHSTP